MHDFPTGLSLTLLTMPHDLVLRYQTLRSRHQRFFLGMQKVRRKDHQQVFDYLDRPLTVH